jgi:HEAT repeat protein
MRSLLLVLILASNAVAQTPLDAAHDFLKKSLSDTNPEKRRLAAAAMSASAPTRKALELLYDAMNNDKDPAVRQAAATSLGEMKARAAIPKLRTAMDNDPELRFAAARSLWAIGDRSGKDVLIQEATAKLKNPTSMIGEAKLEASRRLHDPNGLAKMGEEQVAGLLLGPFSIGLTAVNELSKDGGAQNRLLALSLLAEQCSADGSAALRSALENDKNEIVRAGAAKALGICGNSGDLSNLALIVQSEKYRVQLAAAAAIVRLTRPLK